MSDPLVSVITATTGNPLLRRCVESVANQTHKNVQHLVFVDGIDNRKKAFSQLAEIDSRLDVIQLPYSVGKDRWNGHRMYGAGTYLAEGQFLIFLDDDNALEQNHIENCLKVIDNGNQWSFSLRKLVDSTGKILGLDDCESLGKWPSILSPNDFFVDVNCYFIPRLLAVTISPIWYCKFREPGQAEIDRKICFALRELAPKYECTYDYSVLYNVGNSPLSVQPEFFERGNAAMLRHYNGVLPWKKNQNEVHSG